MSDLSDEVMSDEESAEVYRQVFGEGEPEYMFEQLIDGPNVEQFDNEKERDETNENMVVESLCENKMARTTYDKLLDNIRKWIGRFRESSLVIFREEIILHGTVLKKLVGGILDRVAEERAGDQVGVAILDRWIDIYCELFFDVGERVSICKAVNF
ncbi:hypothetical protein OSTOST_24613, partial [Ostertagia ostertagi]